MSNPTVYQVRRGATFRMALRVKSGTVTGDEQIRAVGKAITSKFAQPPGDDASDAFVLQPLFVAASGDVPAMWYLTLTDEDCAALDVGYYAVDARIPLPDGSVIQTAHVVFEVTERVTEPA